MARALDAHFYEPPSNLLLVQYNRIDHVFAHGYTVSGGRLLTMTIFFLAAEKARKNMKYNFSDDESYVFLWCGCEIRF